MKSSTSKETQENSTIGVSATDEKADIMAFENYPVNVSTSSPVAIKGSSRHEAIETSIIDMGPIHADLGFLSASVPVKKPMGLTLDSYRRFSEPTTQTDVISSSVPNDYSIEKKDSSPAASPSMKDRHKQDVPLIVWW